MIKEITMNQIQLQVGMKAPDFKAVTTSGDSVALSDFKGKTVILYFYPKDDTPGCTVEACSFRDAKDDIKALGAVVLGVSRDSVDSHKQFAEKFSLNFPLLADENSEIINAYGVTKRDTFLIDKDGAINKIWKDVNVEGHDQEVMDAIRALK
jgi:thioredoxin-dependent peroxiredoxin